jgi:glycosyltransferase involved in cell wall biosynthesis
MNKDSSKKQRRVLIIVENLPVPFDRRVWQEATTLKSAGYDVSVICPKGFEHKKSREVLDGIHIFRYPNPVEADRPLGYLLEYGMALLWQFSLSIRIALGTGFDVIHACNPPDNIFLVGGFFKLFGKKFLFDHHDVCPELFSAKFSDKPALLNLTYMLERLTFKIADVSIATNESYKTIAVARGKMLPEDVFVVRSGPNLERLKILPPDPTFKCGRQYLVGYVGVMGKQEGIDHLLRAVYHIVRERNREDVQFALIGGGTELEAMRRYARELGIDEFVTFTGRLPDNKLLAILNTADICVNPDSVNEMNQMSTMNKVMEYMAIGKAQVQFEMVEGRVSAASASLYAAPNDATDLGGKILKLLDDEPLRVRMGKIGRERIENKLQWKHEAPKLLEAYSAVFRD